MLRSLRTWEAGSAMSSGLRESFPTLVGTLKDLSDLIFWGGKLTQKPEWSRWVLHAGALGGSRWNSAEDDGKWIFVLFFQDLPVSQHGAFPGGKTQEFDNNGATRQENQNEQMAAKSYGILQKKIAGESEQGNANFRSFAILVLKWSIHF